MIPRQADVAASPGSEVNDDPESEGLLEEALLLIHGPALQQHVAVTVGGQAETAPVQGGGDRTDQLTALAVKPVHQAQDRAQVVDQHAIPGASDAYGR